MLADLCWNSYPNKYLVPTNLVKYLSDLPELADLLIAKKIRSQT